ncbi:MAG: hypothetical protein AMJ88_01485 [Anaerolineae bacterium SM23_ 63]|nr:MAG: hypothetical protein AMJ88_01485 [Anaerolineae bacterium SM23_ 63]
MVMGTAWLVVQRHLPEILDPSVYGQLRMPTSNVGNFFIGVWPRWDAVHHLNLAMGGYFASSPGESVFYPLYAGLTWLLALVLGGRYIEAGLLLSTITAAAVFVFLILIGDHLFGDESGKWAAISLAAYPTAVFLIAPFTEALFLALTLSAIYLAYLGRWWPAAVSAFLASLARGPGLTLSLPLAILAIRQWDSTHRPIRFQAVSVLVAVAAPLVGGVSFLAWRSIAGFPSMSETLRQYTGTTFVDPLTGIVTALRQWITILDLPTTLDTLSALLFLAVTVVMAFNPRWRKIELLAYMLVNIGFLLSRRTENATSLKSISRYVLVLFPAFLVAGDYLKQARSATRFLYLVISSSLLIVLSALYALWFFLG